MCLKAEACALQVQYIGYYDDELEAAKAYDRAILKFRGPGHQVNFPEADYIPEEIASAPKVEPQVRAQSLSVAIAEGAATHGLLLDSCKEYWR